MSGIGAHDLARVADWVRRETGIDLDASKAYLVESRLTPLLPDFGLRALGELPAALGRGDPRLRNAMIDAITTGETSFFRDTKPFDLLRHKLVPEILDRDPAAPLRIWSAASSSGQEIYSMAMALKEILFDLQRFDVRILGTDISDAAIARASKAEYSHFEIGRGLTPQQVDRYFVRVGDRYRVADDLRGIVTFRRLNLLRDTASVGPFDIVFCRNVACYFDRDTRGALFGNIAAALRPRGTLVLGSTESIVDPGGRFRREEFRDTFFYRRAD
jgi:chemotaxis protein methyltransferase CheR